MPKGSEELTNARKEEIINACARLYETMGFKDITIKEIGNVTSFTRTSIYNYFNTKEEIFLALLQKEYELWVEDLKKIMEENETLSNSQLADAFARTLERRELLLKIMSMNHFDMEKNSRMENLVEFKKAYGSSIDAVDLVLKKFCPQMDENDRQDFIYAFFPFIYGIYPYARVTDKQRSAMEQAGINYRYMSIYEMAYMCALRLLAADSKEA